MKERDYSKLVVAFAGTVWEAGVVQSLLANAGIESYLKDFIRETMEPYQVSAGGISPVKVIISENDVEKAKPIVDQYFKNLNEK